LVGAGLAEVKEALKISLALVDAGDDWGRRSMSF
jgi:hypothetical protein